MSCRQKDPAQHSPAPNPVKQEVKAPLQVLSIHFALRSGPPDASLGIWCRRSAKAMMSARLWPKAEIQTEALHK
jgi:hypothetical protein